MMKSISLLVIAFALLLSSPATARPCTEWTGVGVGIMDLARLRTERRNVTDHDTYHQNIIDAFWVAGAKQDFLSRITNGLVGAGPFNASRAGNAINTAALVDLVLFARSPSAELRNYMAFLMEQAADDLFDPTKYRALITNADDLMEYPMIRKQHLREVTSGSGGIGRFFLNSQDDDLIYKGDQQANHDLEHIKDEPKIIKELEPYGGPKYYGIYRLEVDGTETEGHWRAGVAMEKLDGVDLFKLASERERGQPLSLTVTAQHVAYLQSLEARLIGNGKHFGEVQRGDFIFQDGGIVRVVDMSVDSGPAATDGRAGLRDIITLTRSLLP